MSNGWAIARLVGLIGAALLALAACTTRAPEVGIYKLGEPYQIQGRWYVPEFDPAYDRVGVASWYGHPFHGRPTANGETFDRNRLSAAHPTLPLPSIVRVTNLSNQRQMELRVNDRGPFVKDRIIDLSQAAARALDVERSGTAPVRVEFLRLADARGVPPEPTVPHAAPSAPAPSATRGVPPEPTVPHAAPSAPSSTAAVTAVAQAQPACPIGHFIQVGAFAEQTRALQLAKQLDAVTMMPVSAEPPQHDHYARVRLGPITDPGAAEAALRQIKQSGYPNAFLVPPTPWPPTEC
jgi:rare lipoprotein A